MTFKVSDNQYGRPALATAGLLVYLTFHLVVVHFVVLSYYTPVLYFMLTTDVIKNGLID